jgi:hypothetical protein
MSVTIERHVGNPNSILANEKNAQADQRRRPSPQATGVGDGGGGPILRISAGGPPLTQQGLEMAAAGQFRILWQRWHGNNGRWLGGVE